MDVKITFNDFTVTGANALNNVTIKLLKGEKGDPGEPTDAQVTSAVNTWLAAHPEATTTVQDGAISYAKLDSTLKAKADDVDDLKSSIEHLTPGLSDDAKQALLNCFAHVAWTDDQGQTYYDNLENALYPPVILESISAVYTQSGDVYDTDTLDSLKSDLVVTAYYDNGTSEAVTTYTLSGTLAVGTSTITVTYGGKTATFQVEVVRATGTYALTDGVYTLDDNASTLTVTNGNHVALDIKTSFAGSRYINITSGVSSANISIINNQPTWFTLPSGANTQFTIKNIVKSGTVSLSMNFRKTGTASSSYGVQPYNATDPTTISYSPSANEDIGCLFIYKTGSMSADCSIEFDVELLVNGARYI